MGPDMRVDPSYQFSVNSLETLHLESGQNHAHNVVLNAFLHIFLFLLVLSVFHRIW